MTSMMLCLEYNTYYDLIKVYQRRRRRRQRPTNWLRSQKRLIKIKCFQVATRLAGKLGA